MTGWTARRSRNTSHTNFAAIAQGFGCQGIRVEKPAGYRPGY